MTDAQSSLLGDAHRHWQQDELTKHVIGLVKERIKRQKDWLLNHASSSDITEFTIRGNLMVLREQERILAILQETQAFIKEIETNENNNRTNSKNMP